MVKITEILQRSRVIPVANIQNKEDAVDLAKALLDGGVNIIEVTLRTDDALDAIRNISRHVPDMCVGVGTAWTATDVHQAVDAGATFVVSPGRSDAVFDACVEQGVPLLPGAQTTSEVAHWVEQGLPAVKFFPAEAAGGIAALRSFAAVFPNLQFCPTGGIGASSAEDYLALPFVPCVGGSWLVKSDLVVQKDWETIKKLARACRNPK